MTHKKPGEFPRIPKDSIIIPQKPENHHDPQTPGSPQKSSEIPRPRNPEKFSQIIFGNLVQNILKCRAPRGKWSKIKK